MGWLQNGLHAITIIGAAYVAYGFYKQLERIGIALELQAMSPRPINEAYRLADEMLTTRTAMASGFGALNRTGEKANEKLEAIAAELRKMQGR
jgi:hypothetical protein